MYARSRGHGQHSEPAQDDEQRGEGIKRRVRRERRDQATRPPVERAQGYRQNQYRWEQDGIQMQQREECAFEYTKVKQEETKRARERGENKRERKEERKKEKRNNKQIKQEKMEEGRNQARRQKGRQKGEGRKKERMWGLKGNTGTIKTEKKGRKKA